MCAKILAQHASMHQQIWFSTHFAARLALGIANKSVQVYDGNNALYSFDAERLPASVYGRSKKAGEDALLGRAIGSGHLYSCS
jgi:hypothetical protein